MKAAIVAAMLVASSCSAIRAELLPETLSDGERCERLQDVDGWASLNERQKEFCGREVLALRRERHREAAYDPVRAERWQRVSDDIYQAFKPPPQPRRSTTRCQTDYFGNVTCQTEEQ